MYRDLTLLSYAGLRPSCILREHNTAFRHSGLSRRSHDRLPAGSRKWRSPTSGCHFRRDPLRADAGRGNRQGNNCQLPSGPVRAGNADSEVCTRGPLQWGASGSIRRNGCRYRRLESSAGVSCIYRWHRKRRKGNGGQNALPIHKIRQNSNAIRDCSGNICGEGA